MKDKILEFYENTKTMEGINKIFSDKFLKTYKSLKSTNKELILDYRSHILRRWFYSTLVSSDLISPANFLGIQIKSKFKEEFTIFPNSILNFHGESLKSMNFNINVYGINIHPIIKDLEILVNRCVPDIELDLNDMPMDDDLIYLLKELSLYDYHYINFLIKLALKLKLIKRLPSIYTNKVQMHRKEHYFWESSLEIQLKKITEEAISISSEMLSEIWPLSTRVFSRGKILSLLKTPVATDIIFEDIYASADMDISDLMCKINSNVDFDNIDLEESEQMALTSIFIMGVYFDMWFTCVFGCFLQLIQPIYVDIYNIEKEIKYLDSYKDESNILEILFSPCSFYDLTNLGEHILLNDKKSERIQNTSLTSTIAKIRSMIK